MTTTRSINSLFEAFRGKRVLIIGDVMIDAYLWGKVDRISPEAPVPVVSVHQRENRLGGAANVALNIRNMGAVPLLCSVTGNDEKGKQFLQLLEEHGLPAHGIVQCASRTTTVKFRIIGNKAQMLRVDEETQEPIDPLSLKKLLEVIQQTIENKQADAIIFEDYDKGVISPVLIAKVVEMAGKQEIPVAVDPKKKHFKEYRHVTLFKPNLKELREGLKLDSSLSHLREIEQAVHLIQDQLGAEIVLTTLSDKGIFFSRKKQGGAYDSGLIPAHMRNIADVSGAGDTVISLATLCLIAGAPVRLLAEICNLAGGLVCEHVGVIPVERDKLYNEALRYFKQTQ